MHAYSPALVMSHACMQACRTGELLVSLPRSCQLSYDGSTEATLLQLISKVPEELWGAKLALRVDLLSPPASVFYRPEFVLAVPLRYFDLLSSYISCPDINDLCSIDVPCRCLRRGY